MQIIKALIPGLIFVLTYTPNVVLGTVVSSPSSDKDLESVHGNPNKHGSVAQVANPMTHPKYSLNAYTDRMLESILQFALPIEVSVEQFWRRASELGGVVQKYAEEHLQSVTDSIGSSSKFGEFRQHMGSLVDNTRLIGEHLRDVDKAGLEDDFTRFLDTVFEELKVAFPSPDEAPTHEKRLALTRNIVAKVEEYLLGVCKKHDIPEDRIRPALDGISLAVEKVVVISGDLIEQHPDLAVAIVFFVAAEVLPVAYILRPLTNFLGFGPIGPVKGSIAAWAQRSFYGSRVTAGSLFSTLQRLGMKPIQRGGKIVLGGVAGAIGFATSLCVRSSH
jgi:hypothetical protein